MAIDRISANDALQLATDVGPGPMQVGAVLVLDGAPTMASVVEAIDLRSRSVPRLRQRLVRPPVGCGRPYWLDDPEVDVRRHVAAVTCPGDGGEQALLAMAAELLARRLPANRPLWAATLVRGLADGGSALVLVFNHVLSDGIGGLAVLANLVDGITTITPDARPSTCRPSWRALFVDAWWTRLRAVAHLPQGLAALRAARRELRASGHPRASRCSMNRPTGTRRRLVVARIDLDPIHAVAHCRGATVNDVLLTAVAGALDATLRRRGDPSIPSFVVSIPVAARRRTTATELGNRLGVMPVVVPAIGPLDGRLTATAAAHRRPTADVGAAAVLLAPAVRLLAWLRLFRWIIGRQRTVHTFLTNLRGPDERLSFLGAEIRDILPLTTVAGNVTVAFAVLSYAGTLAVTVVADPEACPDVDVVRDELQAGLEGFVRGADAPTVTAPAAP